MDACNYNQPPNPSDYQPPLCKTELPRKGWTFTGEINDNEDNLQQCPWCARQYYRYGHVMRHPEVVGTVEVGCDCAGSMSDDYTDPEGHQRRFIAKKAKDESFESAYADAKWETVGNAHQCVMLGYGVTVTQGNPGSYRVKVGRHNVDGFRYSPDTIKQAIRAGLTAVGVL